MTSLGVRRSLFFVHSLFASDRNRGTSQGQATTETVLLFPIFLFFLFAFAKIFALLVLVQKMEIASYYAARRWQLDLPRSFMVGDRYRDIEAGHSAGCRTVLIGDGYGETFKAQPDAKFATLSEAADWILRQPEKA